MVNLMVMVPFPMSGRGRVRCRIRTRATAAADPAHIVQALLQCAEPAASEPIFAEVIIGAPGAVLRLSRLRVADGCREGRQDEERKSHEPTPARPLLNDVSARMKAPSMAD